MSGYGRMGRAIEIQAGAHGHDIVARLGRREIAGGPEVLAERLRGADVAIDFSTGSCLADVARASASAGIPLVTGTTGAPDEAADALRKAAESGIGVVQGPNFSIGVQIFFRLIRTASRLAAAAGGYDAHVHEAHHRHKLDHPSGTARRIADLAVEHDASKARWEAGPPEGVADPFVLYVTSTRAGEIPGTHTLGLEGAHDRIELTHEARSRDGFASGALRAAEWIRDRRGFYTFEEVVDTILGEADMIPPRSTGRAE